MIRRVFKSFQYRDYRLMWIGACTSSIGTWMQNLAQGLLVYNLTNSAFLLGLDAFLSGVPIFLFSLLGGVIADRMDRRHLLLASQWTQMFSAFILTALVGFNVVHVWHVLCLSFLTGLAQAFGGPAYNALVPSLVEKEDLSNAIALQSIQFNVARVLGPAIGGVTLAKLGPAWCFGLNGISFLAPIISLFLVRPRYVPVRAEGSILASMKEGIGFIRQQGAMEALMVLAFCMTGLAIPMLTFLPVFARDIFHDPVTTLTLFFSFSGVGSIIGALTVAGLGNIQYKGRVALLALITLGLGITGFALSRNLILSCAAIFLAGASMIVVFAMVNSLVQLICTNEMRGRVMSVYNFAFRGGMPLGNIVTGRLVPVFSAPSVLAVNGLLLVALAIYFFIGQRRVASL